MQNMQKDVNVAHKRFNRSFGWKISASDAIYSNILKDIICLTSKNPCNGRKIKTVKFLFCEVCK